MCQKKTHYMIKFVLAEGDTHTGTVRARRQLSFVAWATPTTFLGRRLYPASNGVCPDVAFILFVP